MGDDGITAAEAPLLEPEQRRNWEGDWPKSIKYLVWNEFCERFNFYGFRTILALYLLEHLHMNENSATELLHSFMVLCYLLPLVGAVLSDSILGKYRTILYLSIVYCLGNIVLTSAAVPEATGTNSVSFWLTVAGLILIAAGTGGIKPCVSAFGGDQIEFSLPDGPVKERLGRQFFSLYYMAINSGSLISTLLTPVLRETVSYAFAFSVPAALMIIAVLIFFAGRKQYIDRPPGGNVFGQVGRVLFSAVTTRVKSKKSSAGANEPDGDEEDVGLLPDGSNKHWLDAAKETQGSTTVEDVKSLLAVIIVLLPAPLFWSLSDQQSSKWVFQGRVMDGKMPWWLGGITIQPDQMQALNPVLVVLMIPIFDQLIYPFFERRRIPLKPLPRMWIGIALSAVAFVISGGLQMAINAFPVPGADDGTGQSQVSILWQGPQYIVVTAGEILFSITGLEFAYSEAPDSMKSVVQAVWLFSVAGGNLVTVVIVAIIGDNLSQTNEYFFFAFLALLAVLAMVWLSSRFKYRHGVSLPDPERTQKV